MLTMAYLRDEKVHPRGISKYIAGRLAFHIFRRLMCEIADEVDCQVCKSKRIDLLGASPRTVHRNSTRVGCSAKRNPSYRRDSLSH